MTDRALRRRSLLRWVDVIVSAAALLAALAAIADGVPARGVWAAVMVAFAPGWTVVRLLRWQIDLLAVLVACCVSVSITMLATLVLAKWSSWNWQGAASFTAFACAIGLAFTLQRAEAS